MVAVERVDLGRALVGDQVRDVGRVEVAARRGGLRRLERDGLARQLVEARLDLV